MITAFFKSLKIRNKLLFSFSILIVLFIATAAIVFIYSSRVKILTSRVEDTTYPALQATNQIISDIRYLSDRYSSAIMVRNKNIMMETLKQIPALNDKILKLKSYDILDRSVGNEISDQQKYIEESGAAISNEIMRVDDAQYISYNSYNMARFGMMLDGLSRSLYSARDIILERFRKELQRIDGLTKSVIWFVLVSSTLVMILALILAFIVTALITKPVFALTAAMEKVKGGDLYVSIDLPGGDEISALGRHFNDMIAGLRDREKIRETFKHYIDHTIVDEVLKNPDKVHLGGELRNMTVMFSDLAGFTGISEKMQPRELVGFLNEYFEEMVSIMLGYKGTLDKFEGDLLMAFWGAPLKQDDHAVKCCHCALDMQSRMEYLQREWEFRKLPALKMRIGISSGEMLVGNMGSKSIMNYTVMGDAVTLGSRLESAGKKYGVNILISELTYMLTMNYVETRELDMVRVQGRELPIKIYELLAKKDELTGIQKLIVKEFKTGLRRYRNRNWDGAIEAFQHCLDVSRSDLPSHIYIERCRELKENPPPETWDGTYTFATK